MTKSIRTWILVLLWPLGVWGQVDTCGCEKKEINTICHLSVNDFCYNVPGCEHSLDGDFMSNSLALKLKNPKNFGSMGVSECGVTIKKMDPFSQPYEIDEAGCDVFFIGSFAVDTNVYRINSDMTSVPNFILEAIRSWSMACDKNLVVVAQAEAKPWGYIVQNDNQNPNTAISDPSKFSIFNGVFGSLDEFRQGGSYQGVITKQPDTGAEILAKDALGRPTVAFDVATKDLILGDIGILCSTAGYLSNGNQIRASNDNDILAANIFALGCKIGQGTKFTEEIIYKCEGEVFTAPNGLTFLYPGIFVDRYLTSKGCDSLHYTKILDYKKSLTTFQQVQCEGDSSSYRFGSYVFDESFPMGQVLFTDANGCDSVINVNLTYFPNTAYQFSDTVCAESGFVFKAGNDIYSVQNPSGISHIKNTNGCDSAIYVNIRYIHADSTFVSDTICYHDSLSYNNDYLKPGGEYKYRYKAVNPCDSLVFIDVQPYARPDFEVEEEIQMTLYNRYQFDNSLPDDVSIEWSSDPGLSCLSCVDPVFEPVDFSALLTGRVIDRFGCFYPFGVAVKYSCEPILPNVISANGPGSNGEFRWTTTCPVFEFDMRVYDRWGNLMYHSRDTAQAWSAANVLPGVYTYVVEYRDGLDTRTLTGDVTVVR